MSHWIQESAATLRSFLWDRDTFHQPRLLQDPSNPVLNTSRDGELQLIKGCFPSHRWPSSVSLFKRFPLLSGVLLEIFIPSCPKTFNHVCKSLPHKDLKANGNFLGGRAAPGRKTHGGRCEGSSHCRGTLCLLQQQSLIPTLTQHVLIFKNIQ